MLAVLPFQNLTGDPEQEYLCDGLTEEMIASWARVDSSRLGVIARTSAMHYGTRRNEPTRSGGSSGSAICSRRAFGESAIGSESRPSSSRCRLSRTSGPNNTSATRWTPSRSSAKWLLRSHSAPCRASGCRPETATSGGSSFGQFPAYEHYLRGRYHWAKDTIDGLHKARDNFQKAIDLDPSYARAYSGLADTYALLGSYGIMPIGESHPLGREAALKALELDESLADAHRSLAAITADYYWDWQEVERHYARALALDPNDVTTLSFYAFYLAYTGRPVEAVPYRRAGVPARPRVAERTDDPRQCPAARRGDSTTRCGSSRRPWNWTRISALRRRWLDWSTLGRRCPIARLPRCRKRAIWMARVPTSSRSRDTSSRAGRRDEALRALEDLRRLAHPREPSPFPGGTRLRRPGRHGSRLRMARQGGRGASLGDAHDQGQPDLRTGPIGPALSRVAPPDRVARLTRLPRSPAVNR